MRNKELKVRLSEDELDRFSTVCSTEHVPPSTKARELIVEYSQAQLPIQKIESCGATESKEKTACRTAIPQLPDSGELRVAEMFSGPGGIGIALNRTK